MYTRSGSPASAIELDTDEQTRGDLRAARPNNACRVRANELQPGFHKGECLYLGFGSSHKFLLPLPGQVYRGPMGVQHLIRLLSQMRALRYW
jgi:hypothetical protein